jgi:type II secretion system protein G
MAFTLIELLIVVAIIGILAAIAIPNFLNAQVRAKVSRVKSDLRTMANAIEQYQVDWGVTPRQAFDVMVVAGRDNLGYLHVLSTPVDYLSEVPIWDPFTLDLASYPAARQYDYYDFYSCLTVKPESPSEAPKPWLEPARDTHGFYGRSQGPDKGTSGYGPYLRNLLAQVNSLGELNAADPYRTAFFYDPTNGTISTGDICRTRIIVDEPTGIRF